MIFYRRNPLKILKQRSNKGAANMKKVITIFITLTLILTVALTGCSTSQEVTASPSAAPTDTPPTIESTPTPTPTATVASTLTATPSTAPTTTVEATQTADATATAKAAKDKIAKLQLGMTLEEVIKLLGCESFETSLDSTGEYTVHKWIVDTPEPEAFLSVSFSKDNKVVIWGGLYIS